MKLARLFQLRAQRRWLNMRVYRKAAELTQIRNRCNAIKPQDILLFATVKDEYIRLPYFLDYYRKIGIGHFLIVDNNSLDGGRRFWPINKMSRFGQRKRAIKLRVSGSIGCTVY
jgi:hypothetical protein